MNHRVLLICYYFPPLGLGGIGRPLNLFRGLPKHGWDCDILTVKSVTYRAYEPELLEGLDQNKIYRSGSRDPQRFMYLLGMRSISPAKIKKGAEVSKSFFPDSKIGWVKAATRLGRKLCNKNNYSAIISSSPPISSHLIGRELHKQFQIPWIADFRDFWSLYTIENSYTNPTLIKKANLLKDKIVNDADKVTVVNSDIASYLTKGEVIQNGYNSALAEHWCQPPDNENLTIGFLGHHHDDLILKQFITLLEHIKKKTPEVFAKLKIVQVGQIEDAVFRQMLSDSNLDCNIEIYKRQSREDTIKIMSRSHLIFLGISEKQGSGLLPGKTFELLASGRPIVANTPNDSQVGQLIIQSEQGICYQEDTIDQAGGYISKINEQIISKVYRINPISDFAQQYSSDRLVSKFADLLGSLV